MWVGGERVPTAVVAGGGVGSRQVWEERPVCELSWSHKESRGELLMAALFTLAALGQKTNCQAFSKPAVKDSHC